MSEEEFDTTVFFATILPGWVAIVIILIFS